MCSLVSAGRLILSVARATAEGALATTSPLAAGATLADGAALDGAALGASTVLGVCTTAGGGSGLLQGTGHFYYE
jgi:hypothetical protein